MIGKGRESVVALLLEKKAVIDARNHNGMTPLMMTCCWGHADILALLLRKDAKGIKMQDHKGKTALFWAAKKGHVNAIRVLMMSGTLIDIDSPDKTGSTPLMVASAKGHSACVRLVRALLSRSAVVLPRMVEVVWRA